MFGRGNYYRGSWMVPFRQLCNKCFHLSRAKATVNVTVNPASWKSSLFDHKRKWCPDATHDSFHVVLNEVLNEHLSLQSWEIYRALLPQTCRTLNSTSLSPNRNRYVAINTRGYKLTLYPSFLPTSTIMMSTSMYGFLILNNIICIW